MRVAGSHLVVHLQVPLTLGRRGPWGMAFLVCYCLQFHQIILISCADWQTYKSLDQWRNITSNRLLLIWIEVTVFSLDAIVCYSMVLNKWFSSSASAAHDPIMQKEVDELLAKGVWEPLTGGARFYSYGSVVPQCTSALWPIPYIKLFYQYM